MKKLIIGLLMLTGCGEDIAHYGMETIHYGHTVYIVHPYFGYSVACNIAQRTACGYTLYQCDNGYTYFCVTNVEMAQIK
jgi:hypothetical protein